MMPERVGALEGAASKASKDKVNQEQVRAQMQRLLADPLFHNSRRYSSLLTYIVNRSMEGRYDSLKERIIGIEVFGRPPDYDTSIDPTVRVTATEVRKRLALYYSHPSHRDELHIDVPVRSYVAEFRDVESEIVPTLGRAMFPPTGSDAVQPNASLLDQVEPSASTPRYKSKYLYLSVLAILLSTAAIFIGVRFLHPAPALIRFWAPMISGSDPTLICISSSPSVGPANPQQANITGENTTEQKLYEFASKRVNVSMTDVTAATSLAQFLHSHGRNSIIRPAQGTDLADLGGSPVVLLGSYNNDWVMRLGAGLHYRLKKDSDFGVRWIEDSGNPSNKSWAVDLSAPNEQVADDYALVSRILDPATGRWWIGISGLTGIGTLAGYQLTMDPNAMLALTSALPRGWEGKNLQFVVQVRMIQGSPGAARVIGKYIW